VEYQIFHVSASRVKELLSIGRRWSNRLHRCVHH